MITRLTTLFIQAKTPMIGRDHTEPHRAATMLELFYDLVIVIAIASAATQLHHAFAENHFTSGIINFLMAFFSIWWAWMNFTWFASAFDTDDGHYRVAIFIQIAGALVLAAGIKHASTAMNFQLALIGFMIMRASLATLWFRVARNSKEDRKSAFHYAFGIILCQIGWYYLIFHFPKPYFLAGFLFLTICELLVPYIANKSAKTKFHRHHIIERYGLLTIIALGECFLATATGIQLLAAHFSLTLFINVLAGLTITLMMWWLYFDESDHHIINSTTGTFIWGYLHVLVFASIAATGAGLAVVNDQLTGHSQITYQLATATVAIPLSIYLIALWFIHEKPAKLKTAHIIQYPIFSLVSVGCIFIPNGMVFIAGLLILTVLFRSLRTVE